jgi:integrase
MIAPSRCTSRLGPAIERYVTLKQALGRQYAAERWMLGHVDRFLTARDADLTADTFAAWCLTLQHLTTGTRRRRMQVVRNVCLYRRRQEPTCFVPDDRLFPPTHHAIRPYLFTDEDIRRLLTAASALRPSLTSPLRRENVRLAIVVLYTTGLRRGELVSLTLSDYDAGQRTLLIRESKFHKSRVVPLSRDGAGEIDRLLEHRRTQRLPLTPDSHLLWNRSRGGNAYTGAGLHHVLHTLFRSTQIRTEHGRVPRVHDFRHAFAITALLRWYRAGVDVQAKLPLLATYMGHVSIVSTAYYLQFVEPLAAAASERFAGHRGALVTTRLAHGDAR